MNVESIGNLAGVVWCALNDSKGAMTLKNLRKATKLKVSDMHLGIGWLAKEGKLAFNDVDGDVEISLL